MSNWREFWDFAKEIQADFNDGLDVSRDVRQELWLEFNELRGNAKERQTAEWEAFSEQSERLKESILSDCAQVRITGMESFAANIAGAGWSMLKERNVELKELWKTFSGKKTLMTRDHKNECFERLQEAKQSHDDYADLLKSKRRA